MNQGAVNKSVLVLMVIGISALFFSMIHQFLMAIFLAGLFSALARPVYRRLKISFNGHKHLASVTTLLMMIVVVLIPMMLLVGIIVAQAIDVGQSVTPWIKQTIEQPDKFSTYLQHLPFYDQLVPYREIILEKAGKVVGEISKWIVGGLSQATLGTANFLFMSFVFLYTMYFFQLDGDKLVRKILYYLPLNSDDENLMMDKFTSVTRATIKGNNADRHTAGRSRRRCFCSCRYRKRRVLGHDHGGTVDHTQCRFGTGVDPCFNRPDHRRLALPAE